MCSWLPYFCGVPGRSGCLTLGIEEFTFALDRGPATKDRLPRDSDGAGKVVPDVAGICDLQFTDSVAARALLPAV